MFTRDSACVLNKDNHYFFVFALLHHHRHCRRYRLHAFASSFGLELISPVVPFFFCASSPLQGSLPRMSLELNYVWCFVGLIAVAHILAILVVLSRMWTATPKALIRFDERSRVGVPAWKKAQKKD
ncbi:hypothetical protein DQ04_00251180 [Trypanosoma grayi]|uniref:hypothetical protein n=1 Tax=Trypanosoma grayi TaxID=71804 RepID=UPI0004F45434|nr:hypothetical protein DQ04_00251180 [Trypanosoma grayi]KEG14942.1 hypothetical protein DQ04_00251180 [Trypanosoma grayi]